MRVAWRFAFALMALFVISVAAPSEYLAHPNGTAVIDEAGILRPAARESLNEILTTFDKNSTNQIMFVSLKSLGDYSIEEIGVEQARALGIGQKGRDNGDKSHIKGKKVRLIKNVVQIAIWAIFVSI
ncbi:YgcG family protein [uncultured Campylobacter sp.]|uniref:TPM domain-containing protein n=1 Tax=uncultured Campylobacter sp. TaxID=218934 RepID=UPI0026018E30|nr:TPM domain-containing protein [uncultured Campylobacter sp.]